MSKRECHIIPARNGPPIPTDEELSGGWMDAYGWSAMELKMPSISLRKEVGHREIGIDHAYGPDTDRYDITISGFATLAEAKAFCDTVPKE